VAYTFPRCRIVPQADQQAAFMVDGDERLRWHFGPTYPRPFFYPLVGPSGESLTRMGHPGAPNHDHHRSIWFGHAKVLGIDFWSENTAARIRQKNWLVYEDGQQQARMAVMLGWYDGHDPQELLEQELVAVYQPLDEGESLLELHSTFHPKAASLEFGQTNFGVLAVRVAKQISAYFGGGEITSSEGLRGEPAIFGKRAAWMDYSGPAPNGGREGITYFDHPDNPRYPTHWHVREDGWMGASVCLNDRIETTKQQPLVLRYLLQAHRGEPSAKRAGAIAAEFAKRPGYEVVKSMVKHNQFQIRERAASAQSF
jgi:hypothetical protein